MTHDNQNTEHESENARLRREHAAMKAFIQRIANRDKQDYMASPISMQILIDDARTLLAIYADTAIASSAPSPEGGNAGYRVGQFVWHFSTKSYGQIFAIDHNGIHLDMGDMGSTTNGYTSTDAIHIELAHETTSHFVRYCPRCHRVADTENEGYCTCGRALEWTRKANAALPASGSADTVAGSGNGGE